MMKYQDDSMKIINKFRSIHNSPPLTLDEALHQEAKEIAEGLVTTKGAWSRAKDEERERKGGIYQVTCNPDNYVMPATEAMSNWYGETQN